jgi:Ca2+-binding RTX toxin-like protein
MLGGAGPDYLDGGVGTDILRGGDGPDVLVYEPLDGEISGGKGVDTLAVPGGSETVDLAAVSANIRGIEIFELGDAGASSVRISADDVLRLPTAAGMLVPGGDTQILFLGDSFDSVELTGADWILGSPTVIDGVTCATWTAGEATLFVESGVNVIVGAAPESAPRAFGVASGYNASAADYYAGIEEPDAGAAFAGMAAMLQNLRDECDAFPF